MRELLGERCVEVPEARAFVLDCERRYGQAVGLEVGNVLRHYGPIRHAVVDRYEQAPGTFNLDVLALEGGWHWIVSVSTLEHVRWDEEPREPDGTFRAIEHLLGLLMDDGRMLVTLPLGWRPEMDARLEGVAERHWTMTWNGEGWDRHDGVVPLPYGEATPWASAVWFGEWGPR